VMPLATWGFTVLAAVTFVALLQCIVSAVGPAGKLGAIVLLMLQLTSAAGTFPIETVPRFFRTISPFLPMTYVVRGLRQTLAGGDATVVAYCALALTAFLLLGLLGTVLTARRQRMWTMDRLRPALTI
jgi:putative membrane protein